MRKNFHFQNNRKCPDLGLNATSRPDCKSQKAWLDDSRGDSSAVHKAQSWWALQSVTPTINLRIVGLFLFSALWAIKTTYTPTWSNFQATVYNELTEEHASTAAKGDGRNVGKMPMASVPFRLYENLPSPSWLIITCVYSPLPPPWGGSVVVSSFFYINDTKP